MAILLYHDLDGKLVAKCDPTAEDVSECMRVFCLRNKEALTESVGAELRKTSALSRYICDAA